jgi:acetate kinase
MSDTILVFNAGSSSIKLGLFDIATAEPVLRCKGLLDEQERAPRVVVTDASGKELFEKRRSTADDESHGLFDDIFAWIEDYLAGAGLPPSAIASSMAGAIFTNPP